MYAGRGAEYGNATAVFSEPQHPYTWGLLTSMPRMDRAVRDRLRPITDADVVLGYINPQHLVGGALKLNAEKARQAKITLDSLTRAN